MDEYDFDQPTEKPSAPSSLETMMVESRKPDTERFSTGEIRTGGLIISGVKDKGVVRKNNQDNFHVGVVNDAGGSEYGVLLIVADGMGGHKDGEKASALAVEIVSEEYQAGIKNGLTDQKALQNAFSKANTEILTHRHIASGAGTTCTAVVVKPNGDFEGLHIGDSRAYTFGETGLTQISTDHTVVQRFVDSKLITPEEAANHPMSHVLYNAFGQNDELDFSKSDITGSLKVGEQVLLCSDGLSGKVKDRNIAFTSTGRGVQDTVEALVQEANDAGGNDNITVVVARRVE